MVLLASLVHCVKKNCPNIEETDEKYVVLHEQSISTGIDEVKSLCASLKDPPQYSNLFQPITKAETITCLHACIVILCSYIYIYIHTLILIYAV